ncbi:MAG: DUF2306 domain-containing protein [Chitinophagales bacterium]|jgi:uncharacterized membrane protein
MELSRLISLIGKCLLGAGLLIFIYLLLLISLQYIPLRNDVAFLILKENEIKNIHYQIAFFTHVYTSWFVIFFGFFQFWKTLRKGYKKLHLCFGYIYISLILCLAGPSGLVMSVYANGGLIAKTSFILLSILWLYFTYKAYIAIREKNFALHEKYMLRSYALTLSAVSLRLFKMILANTLQLPPMDMYKIVAWSSWIFNLIIAEIYIRRKFPELTTSPTAP